MLPSSNCVMKSTNNQGYGMKRSLFIALVLVWLCTCSFPATDTLHPRPGLIRSLFGDMSLDSDTHALRLRKICGAGVLLS